MAKESIYGIGKEPIFRETFNDTFTTTNNGGGITDVSYSEGIGTFNGASSDVDYGILSQLDSKDEITIRIRFKTSSASVQVLCSKDNTSSRSFQVYMLADGRIAFAIFRNNVLSQVLSTGTYSDGVWHDGVFVNNGTGLYIYIDGQSDGTNLSGGGQFDYDHASFVIGKLGNGTSYFAGSIDLLEIWDEGLSEEEAYNLCNNSRYSSVSNSRLSFELSSERGFFETNGDDGIEISNENNTSIGKQGNISATQFNGTDSVIVLDSPFTLSRISSTISVWFKSETLEDNNFILGYNQTGYILLGIRNSALTLESNTNEDFWLQYSVSNMTPGKWCHLAVVTNSSGTVNSYLDGSLIDTTSPTDDITFQYVGNNSTNQRGWNGLIGKIKVYNTGLSSEEVSRLYTSEKFKYQN